MGDILLDSNDGNQANKWIRNSTSKKRKKKGGGNLPCHSYNAIIKTSGLYIQADFTDKDLCNDTNVFQQPFHPCPTFI